MRRRGFLTTALGAALLAALVCAAPVAAQRAAVPNGTAIADTTGLLVGEEAAQDSLNAWWGGLADQWRLEVPEAIGAFELDPARIDSLTAVGSVALDKLTAGTLWRFEFDPLPRFGYNRVQGATPRMGLRLRNVGPDRPWLRLTAGYGFGSKRPVASLEAGLPLIRRQWRLGALGPDVRGAQYQLLSLRLRAGKDSRLFGGDGRREARTVSSLFYGSDPNHYCEERFASAGVTLRVARRASLGVGIRYTEERPQASNTDWNVLGRRYRPSTVNLPAVALDARALKAGADWGAGPLDLHGALAWHQVETAGTVATSGLSATGEVELGELDVRAKVDALDKWGHQWLLRGRHRSFDGPAPLQWQRSLGDYGSLRGYRAGELMGETAHQASLDLRLNFDLWRTLRVPWLKGLGLQPILFCDWARTERQDGGAATGGVAGLSDEELATLGLVPAEEGWRMDAGFGFGRRFDLPGLGSANKLRLYCARPVGRGSRDRDWRVVLGFER